jgi:hypothetical protein
VDHRAERLADAGVNHALPAELPFRQDFGWRRRLPPASLKWMLHPQSINHTLLRYAFGAETRYQLDKPRLCVPLIGDASR